MHPRPQKGSRQSSLPSSLIPHLYSGPRTPRDSSTRTTLSSPEIHGEENAGNVEQSHPTAPYLLQPIPQLTPTSFPDNSPHIGSRAYSPYDTNLPSPGQADFRGESSATGLAGASVVGHRSAGASPIPHGPPIRSDPFFYASGARSMPTGSLYTIPPTSPTEGSYIPHIWREGEAGSSSFAQTAPYSEAEGSRSRYRNDPDLSRISDRYQGPMTNYAYDRGQGDEYTGGRESPIQGMFICVYATQMRLVHRSVARILFLTSIKF